MLANQSLYRNLPTFLFLTENKPAPAIHLLPLASEFKEQPSQVCFFGMQPLFIWKEGHYIEDAVKGCGGERTLYIVVIA